MTWEDLESDLAELFDDRRDERIEVATQRWSAWRAAREHDRQRSERHLAAARACNARRRARERVERHHAKRNAGRDRAAATRRSVDPLIVACPQCLAAEGRRCRFTFAGKTLETVTPCRPRRTAATKRKSI